jgi:hypothetical protein
VDKMDENVQLKEDIFKILTELESLHCFEIPTTTLERRRIVDNLIDVIKEGTIEELLERMSGRWT